VQAFHGTRSEFASTMAADEIKRADESSSPTT